MVTSPSSVNMVWPSASQSFLVHASRGLVTFDFKLWPLDITTASPLPLAVDIMCIKVDVFMSYRFFIYKSRRCTQAYNNMSTLWPWPLTFDLKTGPRLTSDIVNVNVNYDRAFRLWDRQTDWRTNVTGSLRGRAA